MLKDLKLYGKFIYCTVTLFMFQFVSCMCNLQLTADVELLWYILIHFCGLLWRSECYAGRFKKSKEFCDKFDFRTIEYFMSM